MNRHKNHRSTGLLNIVLLTTALCIFLGGCKDKHDGRLLSAINDAKVYEDKTGRYETVSFLVNSYFSYPILDIKILPIDQSDLKYAVNAPPILGNIYGLNPELPTPSWRGTSSGNLFVWDKTWKTPKQFKVWWERIVDIKRYTASPKYDDYTEKNSKSGTAWCEATFSIEKPLPKEPRRFNLHFYPDGHVEGYISASKEFEAEEPRVKDEDRMKLPVLQDKPCLKEIPNPYYGIPRPIQMN